MATIWKYVLELTDTQTVEMPDGAEILSVANQGDSACIWAIVDPEQEKRTRTIEIFGTGHPVPSASRRFIGTALFGPLVFHFFEANPAAKTINLNTALDFYFFVC